MKIEPKPRICLSCNKEFESLGTGNRICSRCHNNKKRSSTTPMSAISLPPPRKGHT